MLSWVYSTRGGDLGLGQWRKEAIIAAVASLLEALFFWASISLTSTPVGRVAVVGFIVVGFTYKLTHLADDIWEGTSAMDWWAAFAISAAQLGLMVVVGIVLTLLTNRLGH